MKRLKVGIVGAGASGLIAAIFLKRFGADVMLFEQLDRVGKKILATGNGRCNLTNSNIDISRFHGESNKFAHSVLKNFSSKDTQAFFSELGILCKEEEEGKIFPNSDQASSILDVLRYELETLGVKEIVSTKIERIKSVKDEFILFDNLNKKYYVNKVIIATGGKSSPKLGSKGLGYKLAESLGHEIVTPFPSLVQLKLDYKNLKAIKGVKFLGKASIVSGNRTLKEYSGEILFTDYGISGPPILQLSRCALNSYNNEEKTYVDVDMFENISEGELFSMLKDRFRNARNKPIDFSFVGLINKKLIPTLLKDAGISDLKKSSKDITEKEIRDLCSIFKHWSFKVTGSKDWEFSQVTAGGVSTKEINPKSLESKIQRGLFFSGEVIDIDGDCGGFNLQWAWSSGYVAAVNCISS